MSAWGSIGRRLAGIALVICLGALPRATSMASTLPNERPFASHHIVLQLSDRDPEKQSLVLSVANNMLKAFGIDNVAIDVVALGPGIDLLRQGAVNQRRVDSLVAQGVRFDVCMNTVETVERETGKKVALNPNAQPVQAGVARIVTLVEHGYVLVRP